MIVVDASAVVEWLLGTERGLKIERVVLGRGASLHSPALLDVEAIQAFRRLERDHILSSTDAGARIAELVLLPVRRHSHLPLIERTWQLRQNLAAYDATYIALAEALNATLLTCDRKLRNAPGVLIAIEAI